MTGARGIDRRSFLVSVAAAGGALTLGFDVNPAQAGAPELTAWIVIRPDGSVTIPEVLRSAFGGRDRIAPARA